MGVANPQTLTASKRVVVAPEAHSATLLQCLILSCSDRRAEWFRQGADEGGWGAVVFRDAAAARQWAGRAKFFLVVVDLQGEPARDPVGYRELAESLSRQGELLLVVCGNDGDALEEIWAHQLGAWLYLPAVDGCSDLAMLCQQARVVVEKLYGEVPGRHPVQDTAH